MSRSLLITIGALAVCICWTGARAQSGALMLYELGEPASGAAHAGQSAIARDASTSYMNPAGMTRLKGSEFLVGLQPVKLVLEFEADSRTTTTGGNGGDAGEWIPSGGLFLVHSLTNDIKIGFSVTGIKGAAYDYGTSWVGRYFTIDGDLAVFNLEPSIGLRVNEWLSIGAGIDIQYAQLDQSIAVNRAFQGRPDGSVDLDLDSWDVGFSLGLLAELSEQPRLGLRYRYEVEHNLGGDIDTLAGFTVSADTDLTVPMGLNLSLYHDINTQWALLADVGWTDWSSFDYTVINVESANAVSGVIPRNWDDTWRVGLGAHYRPAERWLIQFGGRTTALPSTRRISRPMRRSASSGASPSVWSMRSTIDSEWAATTRSSTRQM